MNKLKFKITKKELLNLYRKQKLSAYKIGKIIGCSTTTIYKLIIKYNIPIRSQSEYMLGNKHCKSGKDNYNWKGGLTKKIYHCKEKGCNNIVTYDTALYGSGRCGSCAQIEKCKTYPHNKGMLGKHHSKKSKEKMRTTLQKHHIYLEKNSNDIMKLTKSKHILLHRRVYEYIYEIYGKKGINNYIKWFDKKYSLK